MKSELQIIEEYIDYYNEREFVEKLTVPEQALYKCHLRDTISFALFSTHARLKELFSNLTTPFDCDNMDG